MAGPTPTRIYQAASTPSFEVARFVVLSPAQAPTAVIVACPGENQDGSRWLTENLWSNMPQRNRWAVVTCHFVSDSKLLRKEQGYFAAETGSGEALLKALATFDLQHKPLMLYGFSGGAHFVASFAKGYPDRVTAWAAYSAAHWTQPNAGMIAPAVIGCGQEDAIRYGATLAFFQSGRRLNHPWVWVSTAGTGHQRVDEFERFVIQAFERILRGTESVVEVDRTTKKPVAMSRRADLTSVCVIPASVELLDDWKRIHSP